jgi:hypothetical protein
MRGAPVHPVERATLPRELAMSIETLRGLSPNARQDQTLWMDAAADVAEATLGWLPASDLQGVWSAPAWTADAATVPAIAEVMALYAATAARDPVAMGTRARAVLSYPHPVTPRIREQALVIAQLSALAQGDDASVEPLHQQYGRQVTQAERYRMVRYLLRIQGAPAAR